MASTIDPCELVDWAVRLVAVQAGVSRDDALTLLRDTAQATYTPLEDVAELVVDGTVSPERPWSRHAVPRPYSTSPEEPLRL